MFSNFRSIEWSTISVALFNLEILQFEAQCPRLSPRLSLGQNMRLSMTSLSQIKNIKKTLTF